MKQLSKYNYNEFISDDNKYWENETFGKKDENTLLVVWKIIEIDEQTQKANWTIDLIF